MELRPASGRNMAENATASEMIRAGAIEIRFKLQAAQ